MLPQLSGFLGRGDEHARQLEIIVLLHELHVPSRHVARLRLTRLDWPFLAGTRRVLPGHARHSFRLTPHAAAPASRPGLQGSVLEEGAPAPPLTDPRP
jgi:hypothetical protein